jgi:hypothetical protein
MRDFRCDICGATRTEIVGEGDWFTIGINDYGLPTKRSRVLHVYAWPLGCDSRQDDLIRHSCSLAHLLDIVTQWSLLGAEKK